MSSKKQSKVQTTVVAMKRKDAEAATDAPIVSLSLPGEKQPEPLEPAVQVLASNLAERTLGGAWNNEQAREAFGVWASGDRQARQSLVLMVEAYQTRKLAVEQVNMLWVTHAKEDSGRRFVFAFREMCGLLGQGGTDRQHYRSIKKQGQVIVEFDAPKSRAESSGDKETRIYNSVGNYASDLFKSGGASAVEKFGAELASIIEEVSADGKYRKRK